MSVSACGGDAASVLVPSVFDYMEKDFPTWKTEHLNTAIIYQPNAVHTYMALSDVFQMPLDDTRANINRIRIIDDPKIFPYFTYSKSGTCPVGVDICGTCCRF